MKYYKIIIDLKLKFPFMFNRKLKIAFSVIKNILKLLLLYKFYLV